MRSLKSVFQRASKSIQTLAALLASNLSTGFFHALLLSHGPFSTLPVHCILTLETCWPCCRMRTLGVDAGESETPRASSPARRRRVESICDLSRSGEAKSVSWLRKKWATS